MTVLYIFVALSIGCIIGHLSTRGSKSKNETNSEEDEASIEHIETSRYDRLNPNR